MRSQRQIPNREIWQAYSPRPSGRALECAMQHTPARGQPRPTLACRRRHVAPLSHLWSRTRFAPFSQQRWHSLPPQPRCPSTAWMSLGGQCWPSRWTKWAAQTATAPLLPGGWRPTSKNAWAAAEPPPGPRRSACPLWTSGRLAALLFVRGTCMILASTALLFPTFHCIGTRRRCADAPPGAIFSVMIATAGT